MAAKKANYPLVSRNDRDGCLYIVATPIGNLEDITLRALRVLQEVDFIACEDTRQTVKLLNHYKINKRMVSYHEHNEIVRAPKLVMELEQGAVAALVSDAGLPGVSDPGHHLISLAIRHSIPVVPIPGPTAFSAALIASGLTSTYFHFIGFLPPRRLQRRKTLGTLTHQPGTLIFYEAPHRIAASLTDMLAILGDRPAVLARELTKLHEEFHRGHLSQLVAETQEQPLKGEITVLVGPPDQTTQPMATPAENRSILERVERLQKSKKIDQKAALKLVAKDLSINRSAAYRQLQEEKVLRSDALLAED